MSVNARIRPHYLGGEAGANAVRLAHLERAPNYDLLTDGARPGSNLHVLASNVRIEPHLGNLKAAKASVATPRSIITDHSHNGNALADVSLSRRNRRVRMERQAPLADSRTSRTRALLKSPSSQRPFASASLCPARRRTRPIAAHHPAHSRICRRADSSRASTVADRPRRATP